jgi:hypothetical protein
MVILGCPNGRCGHCHHYRAEEQELEAVQHAPDCERGEHGQTRHCAQLELVTGQEVVGRVENVSRRCAMPVPRFCACVRAACRCPRWGPPPRAGRPWSRTCLRLDCNLHPLRQVSRQRSRRHLRRQGHCPPRFVWRCYRRHHRLQVGCHCRH